MNINDDMIRKNKPRLEKQQVWLEITKRMSGDPVGSVQRVCSYIQNLLIWQKELVMAEMFNRLEEDASMNKGKVAEKEQEGYAGCVWCVGGLVDGVACYNILKKPYPRRIIDCPYYKGKK